MRVARNEKFLREATWIGLDCQVKIFHPFSGSDPGARAGNPAPFQGGEDVN
jgi:hypothetical protein